MSKVKNGSKVKIHYTGKLMDGTVFDSSREGAPLEFTVGKKEVIPGFEESIIGMSKGEKKTVTIPSDKAYGKHLKELVVEVEKSQLPEGMKPEIGQMLEIRQEKGNNLVVMIVGVSDTKISLDANHPLAGKDLTFEFEVMEVA